MKYEIIERPTFALLRVYLEPGENVFSETGAMVSISGDIEMKTKLAGGLFKSLMRSVAGGEALFINEFVAKSSGYIEFAPALPGDIKYIELSNDSMIIQDGAYLAHHGDLSYEVKFSGLRKLAAGLGFAHLEFSGNGGLWINSYGAIMKKELKDCEKSKTLINKLAKNDIFKDFLVEFLRTYYMEEVCIYYFLTYSFHDILLSAEYIVKESIQNKKILTLLNKLITLKKISEFKLNDHGIALELTLYALEEKAKRANSLKILTPRHSQS